MITLEQIVLPLAESRALAEKVKLDTALVWARVGEDAPWRAMSRQSAHEWQLDREQAGLPLTMAMELVDAPTLSELLDAIRARAPEADIDQTCGHFGPYWRLYRNTEEALYGEPIDGNSKDGSLVQLAALLLEVAK